MKRITTIVGAAVLSAAALSAVAPASATTASTTSSSAGTITTAAECFRPNAADASKVDVFFGYTNSGSSAVTIKDSWNNYINIGGQPNTTPAVGTFAPGKASAAIVVTAPKGAYVSWAVNGAQSNPVYNGGDNYDWNTGKVKIPACGANVGLPADGNGLIAPLGAGAVILTAGAVALASRAKKHHHKA